MLYCIVSCCIGLCCIVSCCIGLCCIVSCCHLQDFYFPEGTGYSIGTADSSSPSFFMLQTHYDNPEGRQGKVKVKVALL